MSPPLYPPPCRQPHQKHKIYRNSFPAFLQRKNVCILGLGDVSCGQWYAKSPWMLHKLHTINNISFIKSLNYISYNDKKTPDSGNNTTSRNVLHNAHFKLWNLRNIILVEVTNTITLTVWICVRTGFMASLFWLRLRTFGTHESLDVADLLNYCGLLNGTFVASTSFLVCNREGVLCARLEWFQRTPCVVSSECTVHE
jgi:hypothetical protein